MTGKGSITLKTQKTFLKKKTNLKTKTYYKKELILDPSSCFYSVVTDQITSERRLNV